MVYDVEACFNFVICFDKNLDERCYFEFIFWHLFTTFGGSQYQAVGICIRGYSRHGYTRCRLQCVGIYLDLNILSLQYLKILDIQAYLITSVLWSAGIAAQHVDAVLLRIMQ